MLKPLLTKSATQNASGTQWPIFVISLPDCVDRRAPLMAQCAALGLSPIVIDAIDGRASLPAACEPLIDRAAMAHSVGRPVSDAECACALSHQIAYARILTENLDGAVILEDDAILPPQFADFIAHKGFAAADFIMLDHNMGRAHKFGHRRWSADITLAPLIANANLTSGYCVSRRAARYIVDRSAPLTSVADWPCDMRPMKPFATVPRIVTSPPEDDASSLIAPGRTGSRTQIPPAPAAIRQRQSPLRFLTRAYWRRWYVKHLTRAL